MKISKIALALTSIGFCAVAIAADEPSKTPTPKVEKIEVTGSNIKRTDRETVAPVTIITREAIERSGKATIAEVLRDMPINSSGGFSETSLNSFASGGSGLSLRGLGGLGTLVLFNGRRVANYPFASNLDETFVDLNQIPASVIDRVEILKDGASALYGSDAIAGVVNVIFRRDFKGFEFAGSVGGETNGNLQQQRLSATFGFGDLGADKYNVFGMAEAYVSNGTTRAEFELTRSDDFSRFYAGEDQRGSTGGTWRAITGPASVRNNRIPVANCSTELIDASRLSPTLTGQSCVGDVGPSVTSLLPDQKRMSTYAKGTFELNENLTATFDAGISRVETDVLQDYNYLTAGATRFVTKTSGGESFLVPQSVRYVIAPGESGNPTGQFAELLIPTFDIGVTSQNIESTNYKFMGGLKGSHFGWDWDSAFGFAKAEATATYNNLLSFSGIANTATLGDPVALILLDGSSAAGLQGAYKPIGTNSAAVLDSMRTKTTRRSEAKVTTADIKGSRELFELPAGPVGLALGLDWRKEELLDTPDAKLKAGDILNFGYTGTTGERDVAALYAELAVPVTRQLDMQFALRRDEYSDFGGSTSPKVGAKLKLGEHIVLRSNWGKGFRAPSLPQISKSDSTAFTRYFDWVGCYTHNYAPSCQGINQGTGTSVGNIIRSNANLEPERTESLTMGLVIAPSADTSFGIDLYRIKWKNIVGTQNIQNILDDEIELGIQRPDVIIRDPSNGALVGVINQFVNFSATETNGVDFDARTRWTTSQGKFGAGIELSYVDEFRQSSKAAQYEGGAVSWTQYAGGNTSTQSAFPRLRGNLRLELDRQDWLFSVTTNLIGHYNQNFPATNFRGEARPEKIPSYVTYDLGTSYRWGKRARVSATVRNVGDKLPPFDPAMSSYGFAADQYAPMARTYNVSFTYKFD